ncbi:glycosyl hydrolase 115 family protein [Flavobacterium algicola]|uniref:glycosyl hydrolase 115 family protein n=1 Tax=Flavobacterium algicola TaxID=556529 RepID=UPI001EFDAB8C|nr:glycosyl hydrolase 115 family protein [Flavobacterium algicola]MCG9793164.1 glycosyl hydrolase 115 family protein [Flavobacterium algicola]
MMKKYNKKRIVFSLIVGMIFLFSCKSNAIIKTNYYLVYGSKASKLELNSINDLKNDLKKVVNGTVTTISDATVLPKNGICFILGTPESSKLIAQLAKEGTISISKDIPGSRGGIWNKVKSKSGSENIVLSGSDVQGLQYAIYDYSKEILGVDALEYWTGKTPKKIKDIDLFKFENRIIPPPQIPILGYFENDVDELANYKGKLLEYDWESYTELINSLVRMRYNAIQLFDMLGRPEFFTRPEYVELKPDYKLRTTYVDSLINYAHEKGMMVQIDISLGYQIKPLDQDKADCWAENKQDWIATWAYYFKETPFKKADIFSLRPRNQVWDWEYKSSCGEDKIEVFNEVYQVLDKMIDDFNPNAKKVLVCYADGMDMFNQNFSPPKDWLVAWSDDGFGGFKYLPKSTKGYQFGTYMHAGFWLNHTVHDPYPQKIDTIMKNMVRDYQADQYCLVNGQQFRPFLLNMEAYSEMAKDVKAFDGEVFYKQWAERYFGKEAAVFAIQSMKKLHDAQADRGGYVEHLWEIRETVSYLSNAPIQRPGKTPIPFDYGVVETDFEHVEKRIEILKSALDAANKGNKHIDKQDLFYHDYILLPVNLYLDLLEFENCLHKMAQFKKSFEEKGNKQDITQAINLLEDAQLKLEIIYKRSLEGDKNPKWKNWYDPKIRRPNNGFPSNEMLQEIKSNLMKLKNN